MCFKKKILFLGFIFMVSISLYPQPDKKNQEVTEENYQLFLDDSIYIVFYFYSMHNPDSLKMLKIVEKIQIINNPRILSVNLDTNYGLRETFKVQDLPALVVIKKRKLIYGLIGYIDDSTILSDFIQNGINNNDFE